MNQAQRKAKGSKFEREVARIFRKHTGLELHRTPLSGGWGKMKTKGDLVAADGVDFPYFVECKKVEGWDLWNCLFSGTGPIYQWWEKAKEQAKAEGKIPLLVFAQRARVPVVIREYDEKESFAQYPYEMDIYWAGMVIGPLETWLKNQEWGN